MALYNCASDLSTRELVWIMTNVASDRPQLNSHREGNAGRSLAASGVDGLPAWEWAAMHHAYRGNQG